MTKIEKYICEFCGKDFDDEAECRKHELQEQFARTHQLTVFFDYRLNKISIKNILSHLVAVEAFQIFEKDEIPLVRKLFKEAGICNPWEDDGGKLPERTGLYVWDYERDRWLMPAKVIEEMNKVLKQFGVDA